MPAKRRKAEKTLAERVGEAVQAVLDELRPRRAAPQRRPTRRTEPEQLERCETCLTRSTRLCDDCGNCPDCCWCEYSELFDADELGLDPETDDQRLYDEEEE